MQKLKKSLAIFLSLLMIMSMFSVTASAEVVKKEDKKLYYSSINAELLNQGLGVISFEQSIDFEAFKTYLIEQFKTCPSGYVDISMFNIPLSRADDLIATINNNIPELFQLGNYFGYQYDGNNIIIGIKPYVRYNWNAEEYAERMEKCEKAGDKLLYGIEDNDSLGELEKAVLIHDRLVAYVEYAEKELESNTLDTIPQVYKMDGVLVDRYAVCNGYALAYTYLARRAGLTVYYCSSDDLHHGWNIVYIDNVPYHLDTTWDDPTWDNAGRANHNNLLLSTTAFSTAPSDHNSGGTIDYDNTPSATTFDNEYWRNNVESQIVRLGNTYYYIDSTTNTLRSTPTLRDQTDDTVIEAATSYISSRWYCNGTGGSYWPCFSRLSTDGRNLYFNSPTAVYKYNVSTGEISTFYTPSQVNASQGKYIYGCYYDGTLLTMDIASMPVWNSKTLFDGRVKVTILNSECADDNHLWKVTTPAVEPTCTTEGNTAGRTCMACGLEEAAQTCATIPHTYTAQTVKDEAKKSDATCTSPAVYRYSCSGCGLVEVNNDAHTFTSGNALGHDYATAVTQPTCTEGGYTTYTCSVCGHSYTDNETAATGHNWTWVIDKEATCGVAGKKHEECTKCDATQSMNTTIPATGNHSYNSVVTAPTCTEGGYTTHTCSVCGHSYTDNETAATGHSWIWVTDEEATCGVAGKKHEECTKCDATQSMNTTIPATGNHSYNSVVTAPTCTEGGYTTHTCSVCGHSYTDNETAANGHDCTSVVTEPTCTEGGYTTYTCSVCGYSYIGNETAAKGHDWQWVIDKQPTCTDGEKHEECSVCETKRNEHTTIEATGQHAYAEVVTEPTCTEGGYTTYTCSVCSHSYVGNETTAKGHDWLWKIDTEPTCVDTGSQHQYCSRCDATQNNNTVINATGIHDYKSVVTQPTCTEDGYTTFTCSVCNDSYEQAGEPATGHSWTWVNDQEPTCSEAGLKHEVCGNCGDTRSENTPIDATGVHDWEWVTDEQPTCGQAGVKHQKCKNCTATQNENTPIDATGAHNYTSSVTAPTCTDDGYTTFTCSTCGDSYTQAGAPATGHNWVWVVDNQPSCGVDGKKHEECTKCGARQNEDTVISAINAHDWEWVIDELPTCGVDGYKHEECKICHAKQNENTVIPATGSHAYDAYVTPPTCVNDGYTTVICRICSYTDVIDITPATGAHAFEWIIDSYPTCVTEGLQHQRCKNCEMVINEDTVIPATGSHRYTDKVISDETRKSEATCTSAATYYYSCEVCGKVEENDNHVFVSGTVTDHEGEWKITLTPTCARTGKNEYLCKNCGINLGQTEVIPKTEDHQPVTVAAKAPTCTKDGHSAYTKCSVCNKELTSPTVIKALGHDMDGNKCKRCDFECDHSCHNTSGINAIFYKIACFFWKLFGTNKTCKCGKPHY